MIRRPPRSTRTDTLFPYTTLFRSAEAMSDFLANAEDQIAGGTTFEEFAKDASLPIKATPLIVSGGASPQKPDYQPRSEEHTSELQSLMRISYAVFCLKKKKHKTNAPTNVR